MFDIPDAIKSVGEAFESLTNYLKTSKEQQSETQIIKDKKRLKKACNYAEDILIFFDRYKDRFTADEWEEYLKLKEKFYNCN